MAETRHSDVTTPDGRTLRVHDSGAPGGPALVAHHGTPSAGNRYRAEIESAESRGLRLVAYDRPGYGGSTAAAGRTVADAAADVAAILDALGVERFATYGWSGGGPHALACAALLPDRCAAVATLAGVGPSDAPDLDFLAGMGEGNIVEFGVAREGREPLVAFCREQAEAMRAASPEELAGALRPHLSDIDAAALTGAVAEFLHGTLVDGVRPGVDGWVDDDLAFAAPWGFDLDRVRAPVLVWQGEQDLMVPGAHGDWLRTHLATAEGEVLAGEGHITLFANRVGDVHAWLQERLAAASSPTAA
jgi:pimeloyl-ACP methyl ester carboxylesterase